MTKPGPVRELVLKSLRKWGPSTSRQLADRLHLKPQIVRNCLWVLHVQLRVWKSDDYPAKWGMEE